MRRKHIYGVVGGTGPPASRIRRDFIYPPNIIAQGVAAGTL
jgi:hypothetical protein